MTNYQKKVLLQQIDEKQLILSQKYIEPNLTKLESYFYELRADLDSYILFLNKKQENYSLNHELRNYTNIRIQKYTSEALKRYPMGACYFITHAVFPFLEKEMVMNSQLNFLNQFVQEGGIFKTIWGQLRNEVFQTAFQIGTYYVDISNDTVILTKPKIDICLLHETTFKNLDSLQEYIDIRESYHKVEIYPNLYYPNLVSFIPIFLVKNNNVKLTTTFAIRELILDKGWQEVEAFLTHNSSKKLPEIYLSKIENAFNNISSNKSFAELLRRNDYLDKKNDWKECFLTSTNLTCLDQNLKKVNNVLKIMKLTTQKNVNLTI